MAAAAFNPSAISLTQQQRRRRKDSTNSPLPGAGRQKLPGARRAPCVTAKPNARAAASPLHPQNAARSAARAPRPADFGEPRKNSPPIPTGKLNCAEGTCYPVIKSANNNTSADFCCYSSSSRTVLWLYAIRLNNAPTIPVQRNIAAIPLPVPVPTIVCRKPASGLSEAINGSKT